MTNKQKAKPRRVAATPKQRPVLVEIGVGVVQPDGSIRLKLTSWARLTLDGEPVPSPDLDPPFCPSSFPTPKSPGLRSSESPGSSLRSCTFACMPVQQGRRRCPHEARS